MNLNPKLESMSLTKLEKIHHVYLGVIKERERRGQIEGFKLEGKNQKDFIDRTFKMFVGIFNTARTIKEEPGDLLGTRYIIGMLRALPLENVKAGEREIVASIKKKKELTRQKLDQGNLDNLIKDCL